MKLGEEKSSKMKSYGGKKKKNPRDDEGHRHQQEEIQKAVEVLLECREEIIDLNPRSPYPEPDKTLSVGKSEKKYGGSRPRRWVSLQAPLPKLSRDQQRRIDCIPTREDDVTDKSAMRGLERKRKIPGRKCNQTLAGGNKGCFNWDGENIGLEEIKEFESFYEDLASSSEHSLEAILKAEPKNSSISRERNFFFEVYLKYQMIIGMISNVSTDTLMSLLSSHHLDNEDFKQMIMKEKKSQDTASPGSSSSSVSSTDLPQPPVSPSVPQPPSVRQPPVSPSVTQPLVSLSVPQPLVSLSGDEQPLDLSLPTRERASEGLEPALSLSKSERRKRMKKESSLEKGEKKQGKEAKGEVKHPKKKKIKEKPTKNVQSVDKEGNSTQTSTSTSKSSKNDDNKIKEEFETSVFVSMEEKSQEVQEMILPVRQVPNLGISETATTITIEDKDLWKELESVSDLKESPVDMNVNFDFDLFGP